MTPNMQIFMGSALLVVCSLIHVGVVAGSMPFMKWVGHKLEDSKVMVRTAGLLGVGVMLILLAHTVQVWTWAFAFMLSGAFSDLNTSFYYSMVTYTTLGYGDIVLGPTERIFGTFAAITGLLTFGISSAFLISLLVALFPAMNNRY
jgi:hypothetical protein